MKRKLIALAADRTAALNAAEAALNAEDRQEYTAQMERVHNIEAQMQDVRDLIAARETVIDPDRMTEAEVMDMAAERGAQLLRGDAVNFTTAEIRRAINAVTIGGTLVQPTGGDSEVHETPAPVASIIDRVQVADLTGLGGYEVPYVVSEMAAQPGDIATNSGVARTATDPTFAISVLKPYEVTTTSYIDRNLAKISPARYYEKVREMALRALRRKVAALIVNGDSETNHAMYGITNAVNKAGSSIIATETYGQIDVNTLDTIYFAYGADSELGGEAALLLTKADLKALGAVRGTNEKRRLFTVTPTGNGNTGIIADGGVQIPYILCPDLTSGSFAYGNPLHYLLGLFGGYEVRVDESVKAIERMHTILGDVAVGGNVIEHEGFVVATAT